MRVEIEKKLRNALKIFSVEAGEIRIEHPGSFSHGDYSTNVALVYALEVGKRPKEFAEELAKELQKEKDKRVEKIEVAGGGFINLFLSDSFHKNVVAQILKQKEGYGKNDLLRGKKVMIEYTDPNPFKEFHIAHLMTNVIGESLSRIFSWCGGELKRANYQGDVGLHVAKALWGWKEMASRGEVKGEELIKFSLNDRVSALGTFYARGAEAYDNGGKIAMGEIEEINKKIYEKSDGTINELYELGRAWSLEHFERIYKRLGTKFDFYFFESETGEFGKQIVKENVENGIFEKSEGAIVFRGEKHGLHTRVFVTAAGIPTYEAKELGLANMKYERYPYDLSFIVTGNEIAEYFKVLLKAMELVFPDLAAKTTHLSHGMLRLPSGKMSSRTGNVVPAEALLEEIKKLILSKTDTVRLGKGGEVEVVADTIAVGAVKYSILKQAIGKDVIFDFNASISLLGNSGPYIQYTYARARSVLRKAMGLKISASLGGKIGDYPTVSRLLYRFPEVVLRAGKEYAPHQIATYLFELAQAFNNFYAEEKILEDSSAAAHKVALTEAVATVLKNGLFLLGIDAPERM